MQESACARCQRHRGAIFKSYISPHGSFTFRLCNLPVGQLLRPLAGYQCGYQLLGHTPFGVTYQIPGIADAYIMNHSSCKSTVME